MKAVTFVVAVFLSTFFSQLEAQTARVVLDALPDTRVVAHKDDAERDILSLADREENRVTIVWDGETYRWATRENRELIHLLSGIYHIYIDPRGGGWVKVLDQRDLPELLRFDGPDIQFYETVSSGLTVITYWGASPSRWIP